MSDRYISVVTRATSFALYMSWICWQRSRSPTRSYLGCCGDELRQDLPQRLVLVVVVLELLQRGHQRVPPSLGDADREHDEERVEPGLLDDDAVLGEKARDDRRRESPCCANLPDTSSPGVITVALIGSRIVESRRQVAEAVPLLVGAQDPVFALAMPSGASRSGPQTLNHQSLPHSSSTLRIARRKSSASMIDFLDQRGAAGRLHHRRRDVAGRDDRVLRRGRRVHQVRLVEDVPVELPRLRTPAAMICDACEMPARSLCVECVAKITTVLGLAPAKSRAAPIGMKAREHADVPAQRAMGMGAAGPSSFRHLARGDTRRTSSDPASLSSAITSASWPHRARPAAAPGPPG